jgi:hypothetical protein
MLQKVPPCHCRLLSTYVGVFPRLHPRRHAGTGSGSGRHTGTGLIVVATGHVCFVLFL